MLGARYQEITIKIKVDVQVSRIQIVFRITFSKAGSRLASLKQTEELTSVIFFSLLL